MNLVFLIFLFFSQSTKSCPIYNYYDYIHDGHYCVVITGSILNGNRNIEFYKCKENYICEFDSKEKFSKIIENFNGNIEKNYKCISNQFSLKKKQEFDQFNLHMELFDNDINYSNSNNCNIRKDFTENILLDSNLKTNLPGEDCLEDSNCKVVLFYEKIKNKYVEFSTETNSRFGKCNKESLKCEGVKKDEKCQNQNCEGFKKCKNYFSCEVGFYCLINQDLVGDCIPQKKIGENCLSSLDCENNLICHAGNLYSNWIKTCKPIFSIAKGTPLGNNSDSESNFSIKQNEEIFIDPVIKILSCQTGFSYVDTKTNMIVCGELKYHQEIHYDINRNYGLVSCNLKEKCTYLKSFTNDATKDIDEIQFDCKCRLDNSGKGYCPYAFGDYFLKEKNERIIRAWEIKMNNSFSLHTLNRLNDQIKNKHYSSKCIEDVYSKVEFENSNSHIKQNINNSEFCNMDISNFIYFSASFMFMVMIIVY